MSKKDKPNNKLRELNEIQMEFQKVCTQAGHLQYQILVYQNELTTLNNKILELNKEAGARRLLDKKEGKTEVSLPVEPTPSPEDEVTNG